MTISSKQYINRKLSRGATLVELSIILIIIALLVTGATTAKSMLAQSSLIKIMEEIKQIESAVVQFELQHGALPGDFSTASQIWAGANNGDGDGAIRGNDIYYAWQHLYKAGLISSEHTGSVTDLKASAYKAGGVYAIEFLNIPHFNKTGLVIRLAGLESSGGQSFAYYKLFTTEEMGFLDTKMDDGIASRGQVFGIDGSGSAPGQCSGTYNTSGSDISGQPIDYNYAFKGVACRLFYWLDR
jgi:hypothetical protein